MSSFLLQTSFLSVLWAAFLIYMSRRASDPGTVTTTRGKRHREGQWLDIDDEEQHGQFDQIFRWSDLLDSGKADLSELLIATACSLGLMLAIGILIVGVQVGLTLLIFSLHGVLLLVFSGLRAYRGKRRPELSAPLSRPKLVLTGSL
ncbi:hypothetical protein QBC46DRAFT_369330 [Diplogelasinospora grovesii]|uniref:Uncharacterized protein n=1 Tax=Diplogelasinospora grovesii TaxID=303347 RepID=A0AAN6NI36_9PEZI|nr:hypothetical protein QBC46DRAFT_369330 [Diplogelasinospora grovesii]